MKKLFASLTLAAFMLCGVTAFAHSQDSVATTMSSKKKSKKKHKRHHSTASATTGKKK